MTTTREVFAAIEAVRTQEYVLATYYLELDPSIDILDKAVGFAVGQTLGTWVEVPGVTDEMTRHHRGQARPGPGPAAGRPGDPGGGRDAQLPHPDRPPDGELRRGAPHAPHDPARQRRVDVGAGQARRPRAAGRLRRRLPRPSVRHRGPARPRRRPRPAPHAQHDQAVHRPHPGPGRRDLPRHRARRDRHDQGRRAARLARTSRPSTSGSAPSPPPPSRRPRRPASRRSTSPT